MGANQPQQKVPEQMPDNYMNWRIHQHRIRIGLMPQRKAYFDQISQLLSKIPNNIVKCDHSSLYGTSEILFDDNSVYAGEVEGENHLHGHGKLKTSGGIRFEGTFDDNSLVLGLFESSAIEYQGGFRNNLPHGQGQIIFKQMKVKYSGNFKDCMRHGKGTYRVGSKKVKGYWVNDELTGPAMVKIPKIYEFKGTFSQFKREGYGVEKFIGHCSYKGHYHLNQREGVGEFEIFNELKVKGDWARDRLQGRGIKEFYKQKKVESGIYKENKLVRKCPVYFDHEAEGREPELDFASEGSDFDEDEDDNEQMKRQLERLNFYTMTLF